eukprot:Hpha_TRINITY_DN1490_c0_g1::TRINITY_DN1490_c0_g1_i1::g.9568::m.9568
MGCGIVKDVREQNLAKRSKSSGDEHLCATEIDEGKGKGTLTRGRGSSFDREKAIALKFYLHEQDEQESAMEEGVFAERRQKEIQEWIETVAAADPEEFPDTLGESIVPEGSPSSRTSECRTCDQLSSLGGSFYEHRTAVMSRVHMSSSTAEATDTLGLSDTLLDASMLSRLSRLSVPGDNTLPSNGRPKSRAFVVSPPRPERISGGTPPKGTPPREKGLFCVVPVGTDVMDF